MAKLRHALPILLVFTATTGFAAGKQSPPKILNGREIISEDDYPAPALRNEEQGTVHIRLDVDETGAVRGCAVTRSSGSASLDETTCRLFQERAHFRPARDRRGRSVAGIWNGPPITWRIEEGTTEPDEATGTWLRCLYVAASPLFPGPLTREEIADKAFAACSAEEDKMRAATAKPDARPSGKPEDVRRVFRPALLQLIDDGRGGIRL
jgi:TonB family protein